MTKFFIFSNLEKTKKTVLVADSFAICLRQDRFYFTKKGGEKNESNNKKMARNANRSRRNSAV